MLEQLDAQQKQDAERRQRLGDYLTQWRTRLYERAAEWDLETAKHLVVLNAAGLAGVATLIGSEKGNLSGWPGPWLLIGFGSGVILAVLDMHLASWSFYRMGQELDERLMRVADESVAVDRSLAADIKRGSCINRVAVTCGYISATLAILSTGLLGWILLARSN